MFGLQVILVSQGLLESLEVPLKVRTKGDPSPSPLLQVRLVIPTRTLIYLFNHLATIRYGVSASPWVKMQALTFRLQAGGVAGSTGPSKDI